jgi:hypothetical protein
MITNLMPMTEMHTIQPAINQSDIQMTNGQLLARSTIDKDHLHYNHTNGNSKDESMKLIHLINFAESKKYSPSMKIPTK